MKLSFRKTGTGNPLIILHGLYGSGDNWYSIARSLDHKYTVYLVDQRNHGNSPHDPEMNYDVLTDDLRRFFEDNQLKKACLMGHSMGGKVAMHFALKYPGMVERLVVVDIALRNYSDAESNEQIGMHQDIIETLSGLDIMKDSRTEIDGLLAEKIKSKAIRQFLLKNLKRNEEGTGFIWQINIMALNDNLEDLLENVAIEDSTFENPVLVIGGNKSGYIEKDDPEKFRSHFPNVQIEMLDAGHWVHADQPEKFTALLTSFLDC